MQHQSTSVIRQTAEPPPPTLYYRMPTLKRMTGLGRSTIYRMIAKKEFPAQVHIGARAVGWRVADIDLWSEQRPSA